MVLIYQRNGYRYLRDKHSTFYITGSHLKWLVPELSKQEMNRKSCLLSRLYAQGKVSDKIMTEQRLISFSYVGKGP